MEVLDTPDLETIAKVIDDSDINEEIEEWLITKLEIKNAIKDMKNGKVAGIDNITVQRMKADIDTTVNVLHNLLSLVWEEERIPEDWCKGLIVKLKEPGEQCPEVQKVRGKVIIKRIHYQVELMKSWGMSKQVLDVEGAQ